MKHGPYQLIERQLASFFATAAAELFSSFGCVGKLPWWLLGTVMCFWTGCNYVAKDVEVVMCSLDIYVLIWT